MRYRGFVLDDEFVLGYGLHTHDLYRNLPFVAAADRRVVGVTPDAYVEELYGIATDVAGSDGEFRGGGSVTNDRTEEP